MTTGAGCLQGCGLHSSCALSGKLLRTSLTIGCGSVFSTMLFIVSLVMASAVVQAAHHDDELCSNVTVDCTANTVCNRTHNQWYKDCGRAFFGGNCSDVCLTSFNALLNDSIGQRFNSCSCGHVIPCHSFQRRCLGHMPASDQCSDLRPLCHMDPFCSPLQTAYDTKCNEALQAQNCSGACRDSYMKLVKNSIGFARAMCKCDASDDSCIAELNSIRRLCSFGSTAAPHASVRRRTGAIQTATPPTASPTIPPDNCDKLVEQCRGSCKAILGYYAVNCSSNANSNCSEDCKTSLQALLANAVGGQLALCTCTARYPTCTDTSSGLRDQGAACNITVPTRPPPVMPTQPSGSFGLSAMGLLVAAIAITAQLL